ncbi:MAG TPA: glycosyltransferase family 2 protein [Candidatus Bathyarchaeia archaeon]|nr:glycosyltransferase family 2 protein [Candidatus Bathyarchaeia archaeon]
MIVACIPAYDEEKTIARVILTARPYVDKIIVCDDGSHDMTAKIAESLGAIVIRHSNNMGKGATLRTLFRTCLESGAKVIVTIDGDGQHDPAEIPVVVKPVLEGTADISIGARLHGKNEIPFHRRVGNQFLNYLTNIGNGDGKIGDTQSGFRAYSRRAIEEIGVRENGMGVDSQILLDAKKGKLRIAESMISVKYGGETSTHHPARHLGDVLLSLIKYAAEERPLMLLGLPGLLALTVGLVYGALLITIYVNSHQFLFSYALLAVGATLAGLIAILVAILLFTVSNMFKRLRNESHRSTPT